MNIRKNIDYSEMYEALDILMQKNLPQMELYCGIGKAVCQRTEKGAAVMASEYLNEKYPDEKGFSPRSLRRMRDFYRTYENHPTLLSQALKLRWIQNVVIMEADLTMDLREWYMRAAEQFIWTKTELIANIDKNSHKVFVLAIDEELCYTVVQEEKRTDSKKDKIVNTHYSICSSIRRIRRWWAIWEKFSRRWRTMLFPVSMEKRIVFMRC